MNHLASFAEALSDYLTCCAYFTYDQKYELGQDISDAQLESANIVAQLGQNVETSPAELLKEARQWLGALGKDKFERYLYGSVHQILTGTFKPADATDYLQNLNNALAVEFGPLSGEDSDSAVAIEQFCSRCDQRDTSWRVAS